MADIPPHSIEVSVERDVYGDNKLIIGSGKKVVIKKGNPYERIKELFS